MPILATAVLALFSTTPLSAVVLTPWLLRLSPAVRFRSNPFRSVIGVANPQSVGNTDIAFAADALPIRRFPTAIVHPAISGLPPNSFYKPLQFALLVVLLPFPHRFYPLALRLGSVSLRAYCLFVASGYLQQKPVLLTVLFSFAYPPNPLGNFLLCL